MELKYMQEMQEGGFDFSNCLRNRALEHGSQVTVPARATKTGTTIVGLKFKVRLRKLIPAFRTEFAWLPTPEPLAALWLETRTARRSTSWLPTSTFAEQELLLTATT
jgi:hypothetical protein